MPVHSQASGEMEPARRWCWEEAELSLCCLVSIAGASCSRWVVERPRIGAVEGTGSFFGLLPAAGSLDTMAFTNHHGGESSMDGRCSWDGKSSGECSRTARRRFETLGWLADTIDVPQGMVIAVDHEMPEFIKNMPKI